MNEQDVIEYSELEAALRWHLRHNHFPSVPLSMVEPCMAAIDAAVAEEWDEQIALPDGITYKGRDTAPAWAIVEQHHLDAFVQQHHIDTSVWDDLYY